jgi:septum site-determining protein MinD
MQQQQAALAEAPGSAGAAEPQALGRAIVITSGKGGVGKTTATANLGAALAKRGARVVLIDADIGLRNLDVVMGLESRVRYHMLDVLEEKVTLDDALVRDKRIESLYLLAAAQSREKDEVDRGKLVALVERLRERADYVLIDCPAGIESGFKNAVAAASEAIVVCMPEVSSVRDADRVAGLLPPEFRPVLIVNRLRPELVKKGKMLSVEDVDSILRLPLLGVIADEPQVIVATNKGEPPAFDPNSTLGAAFRQMAAKLAGENIPAPSVRIETTFFERLFGGRS